MAEGLGDDFLHDDVEAPVPPALAVIRSKGTNAERVQRLKVLLREGEEVAFTGAACPDRARCPYAAHTHYMHTYTHIHTRVHTRAYSRT